MFDAADVRDRAALQRVFDGHAIDAVVHFAAYKAVGEIVAEAAATTTATTSAAWSALRRRCERARLQHMVFSSSATVYGEPETLPITEDAPLAATNPYGTTKLVGEGILRDLRAPPTPRWRIALLRYFNPVGAHASGRIGEDPRGTRTT